MAEIDKALGFAEEALEAQKELIGKKMNAPIDAYRYLEQMPLDQIAYLLAESTNSAALSKIRAYLNKWRPVRIGLPVVANELEALGMARGEKFEAIVEQVFAIQLTGRGKTPEEREKILRKLSGIKEAPKKKEKEKKPAKAAEKAHGAADSAAKQSHGTAAGKAAIKAQHKAHGAAGKTSAASSKKSSGRK